MKKVIVTGYPYAYLYYFKVFEYASSKEDFVFILPKLWQAKAGKIKINLKPRKDFAVYGRRAASFGGRGWRGLFKGWLPGLIFLLPYLKLKYKSQILYSCSEPNLLTTLFNGLLAKLCGLKHILFTWQNVPPEQRMRGIKLKLSNVLVRWNLRLAAGIICGNRKAEQIINQLQTTNYKLPTMVCPLSGVDVEKFKPADQSKTAKNKVILFYGALEKRKGVEFLVQAFSRLSVPGVELLIIGAGPQKEKLKKMTEDLGLKEKTTFKDWMKNEELPEVLRNSAVFVYPSVPSGGWEEQFGYAMAEASASEVPVVATKTGSIEEVIKNGETGILVDSGQVEQLKEALEKLLIDGGLRERMGLAGRDFVVKNFSHRVVASKINNFLNQFI